MNSLPRHRTRASRILSERDTARLLLRFFTLKSAKINVVSMRHTKNWWTSTAAADKWMVWSIVYFFNCQLSGKLGCAERMGFYWNCCWSIPNFTLEGVSDCWDIKYGFSGKWLAIASRAGLFYDVAWIALGIRTTKGQNRAYFLEARVWAASNNGERAATSKLRVERALQMTVHMLSFRYVWNCIM